MDIKEKGFVGRQYEKYFICPHCECKFIAKEENIKMYQRAVKRDCFYYRREKIIMKCPECSNEISMDENIPKIVEDRIRKRDYRGIEVQQPSWMFFCIPMFTRNKYI